MTTKISLCYFPEELLERILALCVSAPSQPIPVHQPQWHTPAFHAHRTAPLLVCKSFHRIATPLLYQSVHLYAPSQVQAISQTLTSNPHLARFVRCLVLSGIIAGSGRLLSQCSSLSILDFSLDAGISPPPPPAADVDQDTTEFCDALQSMTYLRHLVVRKPNMVYLTLPRTKYILSQLADALQSWDHLETANIAFRLSDDSPPARLPLLDTAAVHTPLNTTPSSPTSPSALLGGPITRLTHALSTCPRLHSFATHLPNLWNEAVLRVSTNKHLDRIVLTDGRMDISVIPEITGGLFLAADHPQAGIVGTGLFLMEARKHTRLSELIRAGTPIIRTRAQTMGPPATHHRSSSGQNVNPTVCAAATASGRGAGMNVTFLATRSSACSSAYASSPSPSSVSAPSAASVPSTPVSVSANSSSRSRTRSTKRRSLGI
ncbi:hypothetical protein AMATHDRAFT_5459 [Amanita thiersii Skay4041]|uniref:Uncharacterized protein n=1 Tax=Amanita thiersii Skay4041 TaxID=703135 RepID=A0A2A9NMA3_9AGAR|nr:hypothetical protein AMATHDRAFT_5459 [Amanita thiersii Skay4041]